MAAHRIARLDHVQLAMPAGCEDDADAFYRDLLGVEADFTPAKKAHPALVVDWIDALAAHLEAAGVSPRWEDDQPGMRHCYVDDPFGNRIELIAE